MDTPVVMAVSLALAGGVRRVGIAFLDAGRRRLGAAEFADDDQFCTLEAVALQLGAKECALLKVGPGHLLMAHVSRMVAAVQDSSCYDNTWNHCKSILGTT